MPKFNVDLLNEYANAYVLTAKRNYSEPKIYDAGGDLSKRFYIYFSFRNPQTGLLQKQTPIYCGANNFKTKAERYEILNSYRKYLKKVLEDGLSPYEDNQHVLESVPEKPVLQAPLPKEETSLTSKLLDTIFKNLELSVLMLLSTRSED